MMTFLHLTIRANLREPLETPTLEMMRSDPATFMYNCFAHNPQPAFWSLPLRHLAMSQDLFHMRAESTEADCIREFLETNHGFTICLA